MLSSCLITSSTLQSNPPWSESKLSSRSLGIGSLLFRTPISWLIICEGVVTADATTSDDGDVLCDGLELLLTTPCARAARSNPDPSGVPLLELFPEPPPFEPVDAELLLVEGAPEPIKLPLGKRDKSGAYDPCC